MLKNVYLGDLKNQTDVKKLEDMIRELYLLANKPEITDTDPNGAIESDKGQLIWFNDSGTLKLRKNTDGSTTWAAI